MSDPQTRDIAVLLTKLRALQPGSPEREAYLQELARRVQTGEYRPDPRKIASKLVEEALGDRSCLSEDDSPEVE